MDLAPPSAGKPQRASRPRPWFWLDGRFVRAGDPCFTLDDWETAHRMAVRVVAHAYGTQLRQFSPYFQLLMGCIERAKLPVPAHVTEKALAQAVCDLLNKNRTFRSVVVSLTAFLHSTCSAVGIYSPTTSLLIQAYPRDARLFQAREKGLLLEYFLGMRRSINDWNGIRWLADPLSWQAQRFASTMGLESCLLINEQNRPVEALTGTLYALVGQRLLTPPIEEGATYDPIREFIPQLAYQCMGVRTEETPIPRDLLRRANEVFIASTERGVEWVLGVADRRYSTRLAANLIDPLNRFFFPEQIL